MATNIEIVNAAVALAHGKDAIIMPAFPWNVNGYLGDSSMSLEERIELYKRNYWQKKLSSNSFVK